MKQTAYNTDLQIFIYLNNSLVEKAKNDNQKKEDEQQPNNKDR